MNKEKFSAIQLFAEGGAVGAQGSDGANASSDNSRVAADSSAAVNEAETADNAEDFYALINGKFKAEYQQMLENALSKRLKSNNRKLAEAQQIIEAKKQEEENERQMADEASEQEFIERFDGWMREADELKQKYPSFDFEYESSNTETGEQFRRLLNSGIDVEGAYTVIHKDEIMGGAMQYAYQRAKQEMADMRTSRSYRPNENSISSEHASAFSYDISKLTPVQRKLIKAAVSRGEKVSAENFRSFL
jgi:hypothetical protein